MEEPLDGPFLCLYSMGWPNSDQASFDRWLLTSPRTYILALRRPPAASHCAASQAGGATAPTAWRACAPRCALICCRCLLGHACSFLEQQRSFLLCRPACVGAPGPRCKVAVMVCTLPLQVARLFGEELGPPLQLDEINVGAFCVPANR